MEFRKLPGPQVERISAARILCSPGRESSLRGQTIGVSSGLITNIFPTGSGEMPTGPSGRDLLAIPALGNGHDHGRGAKFLSFGLKDDALEAWVPGFYARPDVDPYNNALLIMARFAQAGIGSAVHFHTMPRTLEDLERELAAVARAAETVGIRIGLVVPMRDRNRLCYGDDDSILGLLSPDDREAVAGRWAYSRIPVKEQVAFVRDMGARHDSELVQVQFGPLGVQWASDELLAAVAAASQETGRGVHMHLLESKYQREWMDSAYPDGILASLDRMGLLSSRLTVAHGVWLTPSEMDLLAERDVVVSLNTSSNLRLGSGIAPAREMIRRGVAVAIGLDGLALDDDDDALREMRLAHILHRGPGFAEPIPIEAMFAASMRVAARAATGARDHGALAPGMKADVAVLDYGAMSADVVEGLLDEAVLILARGSTRHVRSLIVAGRQVLEDGRVLGVDIDMLQRELVQQIASQKAALRLKQPLIGRYQDALRRFYRSGLHMREGFSPGPECMCGDPAGFVH
jgi:5-methylthioadenosine/S-adenosylhomocysteine deaminase